MLVNYIFRFLCGFQIMFTVYTVIYLIKIIFEI